MSARILIVTCFFATCLGLCKNLYAWQNKFTHPAVTDKATQVSNLDDYLKTQLSLNGGIATNLEWLFPPDIAGLMQDSKSKIKNQGAKWRRQKSEFDLMDQKILVLLTTDSTDYTDFIGWNWGFGCLASTGFWCGRVVVKKLVFSILGTCVLLRFWVVYKWLEVEEKLRFLFREGGDGHEA